MTNRRVLLRGTAATVVAVSTLATGVGAAVATQSKLVQPVQAAHAHQASVTSRNHSHPRRMHLARVLHPTKKYYGVYVSQAPSNMAPLHEVARETGKQPNLSLYYEDWGPHAASGYTNIGISAAQHACRAGMLPMMTWESWSTSDVGPHGIRVTQPAFAPAKISHGKYDRYIRATAERIKSLNCPIALRLDQEVNSNWYPWAVNTPGMHNSPHAYVAMWRHIWRIFHSVHANNVVWVWTPNEQSRKHHGLPALSKSYPGNRYVDWVGIDGYFYHRPHETFHQLFGPTSKQLAHFAAKKPWIIAEVGVGSGPAKARQIKNLLAAVARSKRFNGVNYFDSDKSWNRSDWSFTQTAASLRAFKTGVNRRAYGAGKPGRTPGG